MGSDLYVAYSYTSFFSQASAIMAESITMIQARTSWIFPVGIALVAYSVVCRPQLMKAVVCCLEGKNLVYRQLRP